MTILTPFSARRIKMRSPFATRSEGPGVSTLLTGLLAAWNFDSGVILTDLVANFGSYTLSKTSNTLAEATGGLIGGKCYKNDTVAGYVYHSLDTLANLATFTYSGWFKYPSLAVPHASNRTVRFGSYNYSAWRASIACGITGNQTTFNIGCYYRDAVGDDSFTFAAVDLTTGKAQFENWHLQVLRFDGTTIRANVITTVDDYGGSEVVSTSLPTLTDNDLFLWYPPTTFGGVAHGDNFGVWNRSLTDAEVLELWNGGAGIQYPFTAT